MSLKHLRFKLTFLFLDVIILRHNTVLCNLHRSTLLLLGMRLSCFFYSKIKKTHVSGDQNIVCHWIVGHVLALSCYFCLKWCYQMSCLTWLLTFICRRGWRQRCVGPIWWSLWTRGGRPERPQLRRSSGTACVLNSLAVQQTLLMWRIGLNELKCKCISTGKLCVWDRGPPAGWEGLWEDRNPHRARVLWTRRHEWSSGKRAGDVLVNSHSQD